MMRIPRILEGFSEAVCSSVETTVSELRTNLDFLDVEDSWHGFVLNISVEHSFQF